MVAMVCTPPPSSGMESFRVSVCGLVGGCNAAGLRRQCSPLVCPVRLICAMPLVDGDHDSIKGLIIITSVLLWEV
eukprot:2316076-Rhodomonas_salina.3